MWHGRCYLLSHDFKPPTVWHNPFQMLKHMTHTTCLLQGLGCLPWPPQNGSMKRSISLGRGRGVAEVWQTQKRGHTASHKNCPAAVAKGRTIPIRDYLQDGESSLSKGLQQLSFSWAWVGVVVRKKYLGGTPTNTNLHSETSKVSLWC